jgi:hypothetical protein
MITTNSAAPKVFIFPTLTFGFAAVAAVKVA